MANRCAVALLWALLGSMFSASIVRADEVFERQALEEKINAYVTRRDFVSLDKLAKQERDDLPVNSAGVPYLEDFYRYVEGAAPLYAPSDICGVSERTMAEAWLKANPQSVAAQIVYANALVDLAFCARGSDVADKVPPKVWPIYQHDLDEAESYLAAHQGASYSDPEWFSVMEAVANSQSWSTKDFLVLLERGAARYPLYYPLWDLGMLYYSPNWNGSDEEREAFAKRAVAETETLVGPDLYARLYKWTAKYCCIKDLRTQTAIDWNYMKLSMRSVSHRYPDFSNLQSFATLACGAKDYDEMDYYIDKLLPYPRAALAVKTAGRDGGCDAFELIDSPVFPRGTPTAQSTAKR